MGCYFNTLCASDRGKAYVWKLHSFILEAAVQHCAGYYEGAAETNVLEACRSKALQLSSSNICSFMSQLEACWLLGYQDLWFSLHDADKKV